MLITYGVKKQLGVMKMDDSTLSPVQGEMLPVQDAMLPVQGEILPVQDAMLSAQGAMVPVRGTIVNISRGGDCCSQMISLRTENGIVNFNVGAGTFIVDNRQLRRGMEVVAYYDSSLPVPLIFPPQFRAQIIAAPGRDEQVMLSFFDRNLLSSDRSLQLNIGPNTTVRTVNGQNFGCRPGGRTLLVFYSVTTRSLPPQTTPRMVIVMC